MSLYSSKRPCKEGKQKRLSEEPGHTSLWNCSVLIKNNKWSKFESLSVLASPHGTATFQGFFKEIAQNGLFTAQEWGGRTNRCFFDTNYILCSSVSLVGVFLEIVYVKLCQRVIGNRRCVWRPSARLSRSLFRKKYCWSPPNMSFRIYPLHFDRDVY